MTSKGFAPITGLVRANQALLAHPGCAPNIVGELISPAKQKPGEISYVTSGIGSAPPMRHSASVSSSPTCTRP
jgi:tripartite-type tricarboxylate transporter receptor subunit TctC